MNKLYAGLLSVCFLGSALISATCDEACQAACAVKVVAEVTDKNLDVHCGCNKPKPNRENADSQELEESVDKNIDLECGCSKPKPNREVSEDSKESDEAAEQN